MKTLEKMFREQIPTLYYESHTPQKKLQILCEIVTKWILQHKTEEDYTSEIMFGTTPTITFDKLLKNIH